LIGTGLVLVSLFAVFAGPGLWARCFGPAVVANALVGQSESQIVREYGTPSRDWAGYEELALERPPHLPPGPIRTLIIHPGGFRHLEGGTLWVWLEQKGDAWVCFESCWFADSVQF
jgi:hypothetical protein